MTSFDVFLSHNSKDKPAVRELADALQNRGLSVWLDERELVPGQPWQEALERIIETTKAATVLVGKDGLGPWQTPEMRGCLSEFVDRGLPVIPVLLPDAPSKPELPIFLKQLTWVDLRGGITADGLDRIIWGVTGAKPKKAEVVLDGRFQIQGELGEGGFAIVYKALDQSTGNDVAVKIFKEAISTARVLEQASILESLNHPGIPKLISSGETNDGKPYLVEELIYGEPLSKILTNKRLPAKAAFDVMEAIAECLSHAHSVGVVHRDIKPGNVLIPNGTQFRAAKLIDFGLAARTRNANPSSEVFAGTIAYSAPEMMEGFATAKPSQDIFGLGGLLFTMKFGKAPYQVDNSAEEVENPVAATLAKVARGKVDIPNSSSIGHRTRKLLMRCLNPDATQRPATAAEVVANVRNIQQRGEGVNLRLQSAFLTIAATALIALLLLAGLSSQFPASLRIGILIAVIGTGLGLFLKHWLSGMRSDISEYAMNVLSGVGSREILTRSIAIQVDDLLEQCRSFNEQILVRSLEVLLTEYEVATASADRQAALMNSVQLLDKLTAKMTPWYVRHTPTLVLSVITLSVLTGLAVMTSL